MIKRIVLDTNIFISTFLFGGKLEDFITKLLENHDLYFSRNLIEEVSSKLKEKGASKEILDEFMIIVEHSILVDVKSVVNICRDPKDNFILELARDSQADFLITGDKDLLELKQWEGTKIIRPFEAPRYSLINEPEI